MPPQIKATPLTVKSIMTKKVLSVSPQTPLAEAARLLTVHGFNGLPAVDKQKRLVGIITEYDLISKDSAMHLPTFQMIIQNLPVFRKDRSRFKKEIEAVAKLRVKDVMNNDPLTLAEEATFEEALAAFRKHHRVNPIPVIDAERHVIGVVSRYDVIKSLSIIKK